MEEIVILKLKNGITVIANYQSLTYMLILCYHILLCFHMVSDIKMRCVFLFLYMGRINRWFNIENSEIQAFPAPIRFLHRNAMSIFEI